MVPDDIGQGDVTPSTRPEETPRERRRKRRLGDPTVPGFMPETMDKSIIAIPLLDKIEEEEDRRDDLNSRGIPLPPREAFPVIVDLNLEYGHGRNAARTRVKQLIDQVAAEGKTARLLRTTDVENPQGENPQYVFAEADGPAIRRIAELDNPGGERPPENPPQGPVTMGRGVETRDALSAHRAIYRIWPDFEVRPLIVKSVSTVKADAARSAFAALGADVVWAVVDSGIDGAHPHFALHENLKSLPPLQHYDYTGSPGGALTDELGHGTHVAGIIAGEIAPARDAQGNPVVQAYGVTRHWDEKGGVTLNVLDLTSVSGMAPKCRLVSFKVLDPSGKGRTSSILAALEQIQQLNGYGRRLLIHGVNLSVGYDFQPEWFACGQSPLCIEVDRLVRSGVVVVVAAGNTGYGFQSTRFRGTVAAGMPLSINDPGNAELAITVGSTHRDMPHTYGVSYFSSKGPTGDGRLKPDVVAPGEKVLSCAAGDNEKKAAASVANRPPAQQKTPLYYEESGTSMAAPHVSGIVAAFLSIRREFIGRPEEVKRIFTSTATDLNRDRYFQGHGLVDLMRAIQSV
jgi:serine protease AprX